MNRLIEDENRLLLQIIQHYKPSVIINLHAIHDVKKAGVFADPRTDCNGIALGFEKDRLMALHLATSIKNAGGTVAGNKMDSAATALYYKDPPPVVAGCPQPRNKQGSTLPGLKGAGVSLGSWAATAVCVAGAERPAISILTVEFPGPRTAQDYTNLHEQQQYRKNLSAYTRGLLTALQKGFLNH